MLGSLALIRVLTGQLNTEQYGQLALGLTVAEFINQTVLGGLTGDLDKALPLMRN